MNWPALPFVRLILPFGLGILAGTCRIGIPIYLVAIAFTITCFVLFRLWLLKLPFRQRRWFGGLLFACLLGLGWLLAYYHTPWHRPDHLRHHAAEIRSLRFRVIAIKAGNKSVRLTAEVLAALDSNGASLFSRGKVLVYIPRDSATVRLKAGDCLWVRGRIETIPSPKNPLAFDFATYLRKQGIYHQTFIAPDAWIKMPSGSTALLMSFDSLRERCLRQLRKHLSDSGTLSIAAALILGQRDLISAETRAAYATTGAIHVLAVSGLHVGMIYLGFSWILSLTGCRGRSRRWLRAIILLTSVWCYALLTGGAASVLRAASMFSFMILGEALFRQRQIYNTLAASAFVLLCIDPYLLLDIGFQLSYLAVIGIVFFQTRIYRLWYIPNRLGDYLWKLATVALAAQLTTLPISLFYFHQFPVYFWLSGWVVVPAAMIILATGLLLLLCSPIPGLANLLGHLLDTIIGLMNRLIFEIEQLPGALLDGIWLPGGIVCLLYLALAGLMLALHRHRLSPIRWSLLLLVFVGSWNNLQIARAERQLVLTVYALHRQSAVDIFDGHWAYAFTDSSVDHQKLTAAAGNFRAAHRIRQVDQHHFSDDLETSQILKKGPIILAGDKRIALIDDIPEELPPETIPVHYLIIQHNPDLKVANLLHYFTPDLIVFDPSNHPRRVQAWKADCDRLGIACHDVAEAGAWTNVLR